MSDVRGFIESGILEMYVMGQTTAAEDAEVAQMAALCNEVSNEIDEISITLEHYAATNARQPDPMIQPMLMARIDYLNRMKNGEQPSYPPALHAGSKVIDYKEWLNRKDLEPEEPVVDLYGSILGSTRELTTILVWMKNGAPPETHTDELESFLIVEGTCDITVGTDVHHLKPGDMLTIPLHVPHHVRVTSESACKIILQRAAA